VTTATVERHQTDRDDRVFRIDDSLEPDVPEQGNATHGPYSAYIPNPEEIRAACREIRESWTPEQRRQRQVQPDTVPWNVPHLKLMLSERLAGQEY